MLILMTYICIDKMFIGNEAKSNRNYQSYLYLSSNANEHIGMIKTTQIRDQQFLKEMKTVLSIFSHISFRHFFCLNLTRRLFKLKKEATLLFNLGARHKTFFIIFAKVKALSVIFERSLKTKSYVSKYIVCIYRD